MASGQNVENDLQHQPCASPCPVLPSHTAQLNGCRGSCRLPSPAPHQPQEWGLWLSLWSCSPRGTMSISPIPPLQKNFIGVCAANRFKKITSSGSLTALGV